MVADDCSAGFQFRIVLEGVSPLVWRRMLIPADASIARLHEVLQMSFGWDGEHLHRFVIHGREYGIGYAGGIGFSDDPHLVGLSRFDLRPGERFSDGYDFTSGWRLQLRVEQVSAEPPARARSARAGGGPDHLLHARDPGSAWRSGRGTTSSRSRSGSWPSSPIPPARPGAVTSWTACAHGSDSIASTGPGSTVRWPRPAARGVRHEDDGADHDRGRRGGEPVVVREVFALERGPLAGDNLGLRVGEAKDLLAEVQESMVAAQVDEALAGGVACPGCGTPRRHKDARTIVVRTLFGRLRLPRPPLVALPVRTAADRDVQPAGRPGRGTDDTGAAVPAGDVRRAGVLRPQLTPARRGPAAGPRGWRPSSATSGSASCRPTPTATR